MLRILGIFFVTNGVVMTEICGFLAYVLPSKVDGGLISISSTDKTYSVELFSIQKSELVEFKKIYEILAKEKIVPGILGASEENDKCNLYFTNVFKIDVKTYPHVSSIKATYDKLIKVLKEINYDKEIILRENAFRYSPSTDTYLFVDILELSKNTTQNQLGLSDKYVNDAFVQWIFTYDIPVQSSDNINNTLNQRKQFYYEDYYDRKLISLPGQVYDMCDRFEFTVESSIPTNFKVEIQKKWKFSNNNSDVRRIKNKKIYHQLI